MLDCQLFGLKPWGHHLTNVLLHALNAALVFRVAARLTGALGGACWWRRCLRWHPLHVESVAWVAERKDVLSGFFGLLALRLTPATRRSRIEQSECRSPRVRSAQGPQPVGHASLITYYSSTSSPSLLRPGLDEQADAGDVAVRDVAAGLLALGENAECRVQNARRRHGTRTTLHARVSRSFVLGKVPFFALAAVASILTFVVQKRGGAVTAAENLPLGARVGNALISYCRYLGKLFWPTDLAVFYPHPGHWPLGKVLLAGGLLLGISALVCCAAAAVSLFAGGLAVVCRDAGAGDWTGAGGRTGDGGSLYLSSVAGGADPGGLGRVRTDPRLAASGARRCRWRVVRRSSSAWR